jgi:hypothetical protein
MSLETTLLAVPLPVVRLVLMPTLGTLARCSSFRASEARNMGVLAFVSEIVDITTIFPQRHTLIVMSPVVTGTHPMRVANEERTYFVLNTEVDHFARRLVSLIADTSLSAAALLVLGALELLPPARILRTTGLLLRNLAELLVTLSLERTNATPRDN